MTWRGAIFFTVWDLDSSRVSPEPCSGAHVQAHPTAPLNSGASQGDEPQRALGCLLQFENCLRIESLTAMCHRSPLASCREVHRWKESLACVGRVFADKGLEGMANTVDF